MTFFSMVLVVWFAEVRLGKPPIMATTLFLDRDRAKTRDNPRMAGEKFSGSRQSWHSRFDWITMLPKPATTATGWEKSLGKPPIMAIWLISDRDRAKASATLSGRLGKNSAGVAIDGDHALIGQRLCQNQRNPQPVGKNSSESRQSWPFREDAANGLVKPRRLAKTEKRIRRSARWIAASRSARPLSG